MQQRLQRAARRLAPAWAASRARRYEQARRLAVGMPDLAGRVIDQIGDAVIDGPCAGLRYPPDRLAEVDAPVAKLVGAYESQLHAPLAHAVDSGRSPFIDVGCADGYYAVGLAVRRSDLEVHAFDLARSARSMCAAVAEFNGRANQVTVRRRCNTRQLRRLDLKHALVLADIEGGEFDLFSDGMVTLLRDAVVVIELHRPATHSAAVSLIDRFLPSHRVHELSGVPWDDDAVPALSFLPPADRLKAMSEGRSQFEQTWLVLTPRHGGVQDGGTRAHADPRA